MSQTKTTTMSPEALSTLYGVSLALVNDALKARTLSASNNKIKLIDFRKWCIENRVPCSKPVRCRTCGELLPAYYFPKDSHKRGIGVHKECVSCRRERREKHKAMEIIELKKDYNTVTMDSIDAYLGKKSGDSLKIPLSVFSEEYNLKKEEIIRLYVNTTRSEVSRFDLSRKDILLNRKDAENFIISAFDFKRCSRCGKIMRYTEFHVDNDNQWQGCQSWCKECVAEWGKRARAERREEAQAESELDALLQKYPSLKDKLKSA